ncbi:hypothetical protein [uncultured Bacteroides sp.]|uniref:hypothetical protein n=1 Tax=uncultured Bacteroides sp. TaxID=162156 RepID=UPI002AAA8D84|nr:hypothetical protein [uncultured Bacteroides sp.]
MTNDVKKIKRSINGIDNQDWNTAKLETLAGYYDKAYEIYFRCFINDVYELYNSATRAMQFDYPAEYAKLVEIYKKRLDTLKGEYSIGFEKYDTVEKIREMIFRG